MRLSPVRGAPLAAVPPPLRWECARPGASSPRLVMAGQPATISASASDAMCRWIEEHAGPRSPALVLAIVRAPLDVEPRSLPRYVEVAGMAPKVQGDPLSGALLDLVAVEGHGPGRG